jgi:hypothetical protein
MEIMGQEWKNSANFSQSRVAEVTRSYRSPFRALTAFFTNENSMSV